MGRKGWKKKKVEGTEGVARLACSTGLEQEATEH